MYSTHKRRVKIRGLHLLGGCLLLTGLLVGCATSQPATGPTPVAQTDNAEQVVKAKPQPVQSRVDSYEQPIAGPRTQQETGTMGARESKVDKRVTKLKRPEPVTASEEQFGSSKQELPDRPPTSNVAGSSVPVAAATAGSPAASEGGGCNDKTATTQPSQEPTTPPLPGYPRFACKERMATGEPVWQGQKARFEFVITNEGTVDLDLRMKGG